MDIEKRIKDLNLVLPKATKPVGAYLAFKLVGNLLFISGQVSIDEKGDLIKGKVGENLTTEEGYNAAKRCALSIVSHAKSACDDNLSKIKKAGICAYLKLKTIIKLNEIHNLF